MTAPTTTAVDSSTPALSVDAMIEHWLAHRRLTRRMITLFPDDQLFTFSIGGMRSFGVMAVEMLRMAGPSMRGIATREWGEYENTDATTKDEVLRQWDENTTEIARFAREVPAGRFAETDKAFGQWEDRIVNLLLYIIDNEIHHRGQGYVYLRALGIEPPPFWERD